MKIINAGRKPVGKRIRGLDHGTVYRVLSANTDLQDRVFMVIRGFGGGASVDLTTGQLIPWKGHEELTAITLNATLEVSDI